MQYDLEVIDNADTVYLKWKHSNDDAEAFDAGWELDSITVIRRVNGQYSNVTIAFPLPQDEVL